MYSRAPRLLTHAKQETSAHVGPGAYEMYDKQRPVFEGYAPFLSMTARESIFEVADQVIVAPGPGQYNPLPKSRVKGGKALADKTDRFKQRVSDTPGPGAYSLRQTYPLSLNQRATRVQSYPEVGGTRGVKMERKKAPPSIPCPGQSYGYEEGRDGVLKPQKPPKRDPSLGPAFYAVARDETEATRKYKGVHFGKLTSQRLKFDGKKGPAPGDYDPTASTNDKDGKSPRKGIFESKLPRYHDLIAHQEARKGIPGPGQYSIAGQFDHQRDPGYDVSERPPFGSQSKRFPSAKATVPSPGSYNDPRTAFESLSRTTGLKKSPFGQTAARFKHPHHITQTPAPSAYNNDHVTSLAAEVTRKAIMSSACKGGFGTTSLRTAPLTKPRENELPGPAHYVVEPPVPPTSTAAASAGAGAAATGGTNRNVHLSSTFASVTSRIAPPPQVQQDVPPPGSYEVSDSYNKSQGKGYSSNAVRSSNLSAFGSTARRFEAPPTAVKQQDDVDNPGPGNYETHKHKATGTDCKSGLMVTRETRFREKPNLVPGPGAYERSAELTKRSFNITLNDPAQESTKKKASPPPTRQTFVLGV